MIQQFGTGVRNARANSIASTIGTTAYLRLWSGAIPANPAAARTGTLLATLVLPSSYLSAAAAGVVTKAGTWATAAAGAAASGTATYWDMIDGSNVVHWQGDVSYTPNAQYAFNTNYTQGQKIQNPPNTGNIYNVTTAGTSATSGTGPTGTGASITDGSVTFAYVSSIGSLTVDNPVIQQSQNLTEQTFVFTEGNA